MSATIAYYGGIVTDGLVLYMDAAKRDSYPGTGTVWNSVARGGLATGSLVNGPFYNINSGSIQFDGIDDYVQIVFPFQKTNTISINVWTNFQNLTNVQNPPIFQFTNGIGPEVTPEQKIIGGWISGTSAAVRDAWGRVIDTSSTKNLPVDSTAIVTTNQWNHFCYVADGSNYKLYLNGTYRKQIAYNGTIANYDRVFLCVQGNEYGTETMPIFNIYNRALSDAEVLQNYNATKARFGL